MGGQGEGGYDIWPPRWIKKPDNKNEIKAKIGDTQQFCPKSIEPPLLPPRDRSYPPPLEFQPCASIVINMFVCFITLYCAETCCCCCCCSAKMALLKMQNQYRLIFSCHKEKEERKKYFAWVLTSKLDIQFAKCSLSLQTHLSKDFCNTGLDMDGQ
jgi:hypothetical protein